jgi:hypothetical protein
VLWFFRRSHLSQPTPAIHQALVRQGLRDEVDLATLTVVQRRGTYSGRKVRYFRVFDTGRSAERGLAVRDYSDLDPHPALVLGYGHLEGDGAVVLARQVEGAKDVVR